MNRISKLQRRVTSKVRSTPDRERLVAQGLRLGKNVYFGPGTVLDFDFAWLISIGDNTTLAPGVRVLADDASTRKFIGYTKCAPVDIGNNVFIGADSMILSGVTIGDRSIIGAGSLVSKDVDDGMLVAGNPAKPICSTAEYLERQTERLDEWSNVVKATGLDITQLRPTDHAEIEELVRKHGYGFVR